jgi:lysophospholipase L1-like esterase
MSRHVIILTHLLLALFGISITALLSSGILFAAEQPEGPPGSLSVHADAPNIETVLDPGLDPQFEQQRRDRGFGRFGLTIPLSLVIISTGLLLAYRKSIPRWLLGALLISASSSTTLALVEIGFRSTSDLWAQHVKIRSNCYNSNPRGVFVRSTMADHPESAAWCVDRLESVWETCEHGFQSALPQQKEILAIGDSFTDGVGVFRRQAWPQQLEAELSKQGNTSIAVSNCGHADHDASQVQQRLAAIIDKHRPSVIIYAMTLNDIPPAPASSAGAADVSFQIEDRTSYMTQIAEHPIFGPLARQFAVARFFIERLVTAQIAKQTETMYATLLDDPRRKGVDTAIKAIQAMQTLAKQRGSRFIVILWPMIYRLSDYPFKQTQTQLIELLAANGIDTMDLLPALSTFTDEQLQVHPTDFHPNEIAHRLAARALLHELQHRGWL